MYQTLVEAVLNYGENCPEKKAVCFRKKIVTYGELCKKIRHGAALLEQYQIKKGDRILVTAVSKPEYIIALLAIQYIQATAVPLDKNASAENICYIAQQTEPALMISNTQKASEKLKIISLRAFMEDGQDNACGQYVVPKEDAVLELLFTTGTTGRPKGAILPKRSILANMQNTWHGIGMLESDVVLNPLPLNHSFGMRVLRSALYIGATVVLQNGFSFAKEIENNIIEHNCTAMVSVPASLEIVLGQMQDKAAKILGRLRYIEIGAGSLDIKLKKKLPEMIPDTLIHNTWGSTESGGALFLNVSQNVDKIMSIGKPLEHIRIKVLDENNCEMEATNSEHYGRMALCGDMQMAGYWNMPEQTKDAIQDGWLVTNDLVYLDSDGYVYMLGRADDIINVGGEKVSPVEVENAASEYEGVRECACIGVKDEEGVLGQIPVLYIVSNDRFEEDELIRFLSNRLERYKLPQKYLYIDELPRNKMKKLDRKALYKRFAEIGEQKLTNPIIQNILNRRSIRRFTDKKIAKEILDMLVETGYHAPSGHNLQTWRFTVIPKTEHINSLKETVRLVCQKRKVHFYGFENPACLILVSNDKRNDDGIQDASAAAQNIMLAAASYGIGSVWLNPLMTICDEPEIRTMLDSYTIPKEHIVWAMIALGYPAAAGNRLAKKKDVVYYVD